VYIFLTPVLDGGEWSASRLGCFQPGGIAPRTHWMGLRTVPDTLEKIKHILPLPESNTNSSVVQPVV